MFEFDSLVTLLIGPEKYRIDVHKEVLCRASAFFDAALNGEHYSESSGIMELPEQEVPTFKYFVNWMYTRRLRRYHYPTSGKRPTLYRLERDVVRAAKERNLRYDHHLPWDHPCLKSLDCANYQDTPLLSLVKIYILADALQVRGLQDHVCSTIVQVYYPGSSAGAFWRQGDERPPGLENPVDCINLAWAMIAEPKKDYLCKMLTAITGTYIEDFSEAPFGAAVSPEFIRDSYMTLAKMCNKMKDGEVDQFDICTFHKHDAGCPDHPDFPLYELVQSARKPE